MVFVRVCVCDTVCHRWWHCHWRCREFEPLWPPWWIQLQAHRKVLQRMSCVIRLKTEEQDQTRALPHSLPLEIGVHQHCPIILHGFFIWISIQFNSLSVAPFCSLCWHHFGTNCQLFSEVLTGICPAGRSVGQPGWLIDSSAGQSSLTKTDELCGQSSTDWANFSAALFHPLKAQTNLISAK